MNYNLSSSSDRMKLQRVAADQGYYLEETWREFHLDVIKARMRGHSTPFIWSVRVMLWFPEGTQPDDALAAYKERKRKELLAALFNESFAKAKGESFKCIKLSCFDDCNLDWKLGVGPCGRNVLGLKVIQDRDRGFLTILQWCEDNPGQPDEFDYPLSRFKAMRFYRTDTPKVAPPGKP